MTASRPLLDPLLAAHSRLWSTSVIYADSAPYVISAAYQLEGTLDVDRLRAAVRALPTVHPGLAVRYEVTGGRLCANATDAPGWLDVRDAGPIGGLTADLIQDCIDGWSWQLDEPPHLRVTLVHLAPQRALLVVGAHHVAVDAIGFDRLVTDLMRGYDDPARLAAPPPPAAAPAPPSPAAVQRSLDYWHKELGGGGLAGLRLPVGAPPDAGQQRQGVLLHDEVTFALPVLESQPAATSGTTVIALFGAYLALLADRDEVSIAFPLPPLHGPSVAPNLGVLRLPVTSATTGADLVRDGQRKVLRGILHQDGALDAWNFHREPDSDTLPNIIAQWIQGVDHATALPSLDQLKVTKLDSPLWTSEFDLDLWVLGDGPSLTARLGFRPERVAPAAVRSLARSFGVFYEAALREPDRPVCTLPLTDEVPAAELADPPAVTPDILSALLAVDPALPAVAELNYAGLAERTARLATLLTSHGIGPGTRVAVDLRPGTLTGCQYGIWAVGAVYVPLVADVPKARLRHLLESSGAAAVLTDRLDWYREQLPEFALIDPDDLAGCPPAETLGRPEPESLAYVVFTSGSTGLPKAVEATHANLLGSVRAFQRTVGLPAGARIAQTSAAVFDPSLLEMLLPIELGGCLVVAPDDVRRDPRRLVQWLAAERIDFVEATPTVWQEMLGHLSAGASLPAVCASGGEVLTAQLAARIAERAGTAVWNLYGPSETTIWATVHRCAGAGWPTIGRPLSNTAVRVVNRHLQTLPIGLVGEIVITGTGVTRGYPHDPDLTAARFVTLTDAGPDGRPRRWYRSGDRGWSTSDGELGYAGRADRQVKLGGKRVDLAEVESALTEHPDVRQAVVSIRPLAGRPDDVLCAHVVGVVVGSSGAGGSVDRDDVLRHLREQLPRHMVPAVLVELAELPRTTTGKIDTAALPAPSTDDLLQRAARYVAPSTELEQLVTHAFEQVLGATPVGALDDFFELGGTSLSGLQLGRLLEGLIGKEVPVSTVYDGVTVSGIAALLDGL